MLLAGVDTIRDVILFPTLRPEPETPVTATAGVGGRLRDARPPRRHARRLVPLARLGRATARRRRRRPTPRSPAATDATTVRRVVVRPIRSTIDVDAAAASAADVYLRLHLLSHRLAAPNTLNLDGIFGLLNNVAWTDLGPVAVADLPDVRSPDGRPGRRSPSAASTSSRRCSTTSCRAGVRIADASRVRLGAHLAEGTTVMHEGFCNFNAGTLGASMVEGRISQGVVVGDGTDIGGGASIMGTLSGGGTEQVSIGERCLLGANSGLGISLGDDCVVEAGLYVTAGTLVKLPDGDGRQGP